MTGTGPAGRRVVSPTLVGRQWERSVLVSTVSAPPAVVLVEGEAGIGKTRLVSELAAGSDRRLVVGCCHPIREPFPFGPVIEAVRGLAEELRETRLSPVAGALRPLLPEVAHLLPPQPPPLEDRLAERHRLFRALVEVLGAVGPAVLVLEDLHWADQHTLDLLSYLFAELPAELSLVVTFRGEEVEAAVRMPAAKLPAAVGRADLVLSLLDEQETGALAAAILGADGVSEDLAGYLHARTSGLPFAIEELLALLRTQGTLAHWRGSQLRQALEQLEVPVRIRDPVLERVSRLSDGARFAVKAAAVLQAAVPVSVLTGTCQTPQPQVLPALEELLEAGLLVADGEQVGFRHQLAAQAVYEDIPGPRRSELHRLAARALESLRVVPLGQVAHHLRCAGRLADWAVAAERAADQAVELGHDVEVVRLLGDVLRHAPLGPGLRGRIAVKLAQAAIEALRAGDVAGLIDEVLAHELPRAVRGELRLQLGLLLHEAGDDPVRERQLFADAVSDLDGRPDLKAWAMVALGIPMVAGVPLAEYREWLRRGLEVVPTVGDPVFEVFLLGKAAMVLTPMGDRPWRHLTDRMVERTDGVPRHRRQVNAYWSVGTAACYAGDHELAQRLLNAALEGAAANESIRLEVRLRSSQALLDYCRGVWAGLGDRIEILADELTDNPPARADVEVVGSCLALARGDLDDARRRLADVVGLVGKLGGFDLLPIPVAALARLAVTQGDLDAAIKTVDPVLSTLESRGVWASAARVLPVSAQALVAAAGVDEARELVRNYARELRERDVPLAPAVLRHARGFLAAATDGASAAAREFLAAAERYDTLRCAYEAAQAREQAALAMFEAGEGPAGGTLQAAMTTYRRLGATWDADRVARAAREHRVSMPARHRRGRPGYGTTLSPREREVAELAATGRTNKEIAADLFLSINTVSRHVTAVMRKLGIHSRAAISHRLAGPEPGARSG